MTDLVGCPTCAALRQDLELNAAMLARQCDLARQAELNLAVLQAQVRQLAVFATHQQECELFEGWIGDGWCGKKCTCGLAALLPREPAPDK